MEIYLLDELTADACSRIEEYVGDRQPWPLYLPSDPFPVVYDRLMKANDAWDGAVKGALSRWVEDFPSEFWSMEAGLGVDCTVQELMSPQLNGGASYLYYMEVDGTCAGTQEGGWDDLFIRGRAGTRALAEYVRGKVYLEYEVLREAIEAVAQDIVRRTHPCEERS